jgi:hypothetical protein
MDESQNPWQASLGGASLLKAHGTTSNPAKGIVDAAVAGTFTAKSLTDLITEAAHRRLVASYTQELHACSERMFVEQFHRSLLKNGGADAILDSLRPSFDTAAEAIAAARDVIPTEAPAEEFLRIAQPAALAVWQGLDEHLSVIDRIGGIAAQFGPRNGNFPLIEEYTAGDGFRLEDRAIWCADVPDLESDSRAFRHSDRGHRTSPWFRIPLRLNTVAEAREPDRRWAEASWDATHPNRVVQHQKPDGSVG